MLRVLLMRQLNRSLPQRVMSHLQSPHLLPSSSVRSQRLLLQQAFSTSDPDEKSISRAELEKQRNNYQQARDMYAAGRHISKDVNSEAGSVVFGSSQEGAECNSDPSSNSQTAPPRLMINGEPVPSKTMGRLDTPYMKNSSAIGAARKLEELSKTALFKK